MIPNRRVVLNGIVAHRDDDIRCHKEFVPRCVVELTDTSSKPLEEVGGDNSCSLEGADDGQSSLTKKRPKGICVFRHAGQQDPTRAWASCALIDDLRGSCKRPTTGGPESGAATCDEYYYGDEDH